MNRTILSVIGVVLLGAILWLPLAEAQVLRYVDNVETCSGLIPCYSTITAAIDAAASGDAISVFPGVYHEAVTFSSKGNILLKAHIKALSPVIIAPAGSSDFAVTIVASPGVQVLRFVIESADGGGVAIVGGASSDVVIEENLIRAPIGIRLSGVFDCVLRNNTMIGGGINGSLGAMRCVIDGNTLDGAGIFIGNGRFEPTENTIRRNVVRGGSISLSGRGLFDNTIESNFVSGSGADGISLSAGQGGSSLVQKNTSIENAGCDIADNSPNNLAGAIWRKNRFGTGCGFATD